MMDSPIVLVERSKSFEEIRQGEGNPDESRKRSECKQEREQIQGTPPSMCKSLALAGQRKRGGDVSFSPAAFLRIIH
jgi:hypothetical protein